MSTLTTSSWHDSSLRSAGTQAHSYGSLHQSTYQPLRTPAATGTRRISGKRKRSEVHTVTEHPLHPSPLATPYVPYQGAQQQRPRAAPEPANSPSPLICERYRTARGQNTPNMSTQVMTMQLHDTPELACYRSNWTPGGDKLGITSATPLGREANGKARLTRDAIRGGWTRLAFGMMGGMAGSLFTFCYSLLPILPQVQHADAADSRTDSWYPSATPLPGMYPSDDDFESPSATPIRPAKRIHTDTGGSWVMLDDTPAEPIRLSPRKVSTGHARSNSTASRASSRRSLAPRSRKSTSVSYASPLHITPPPDATGHRRRASMASTRAATRTLRPRSSLQQLGGHRMVEVVSEEDRTTRDSLSPEAREWVVLRERREKDADKSMRKMSRQVRELIRQGQEALGSGSECGEEEEEGWR